MVGMTNDKDQMSNKIVSYVDIITQYLKIKKLISTFLFYLTFRGKFGKF